LDGVGNIGQQGDPLSVMVFGWRQQPDGAAGDDADAATSHERSPRSATWAMLGHVRSRMVA
jgi:hypothetical protein